MKSVIAISALLLVVIVCYASAQSNHGQWGNPGWNEIPAFTTNVKKSYFLLSVVTLEVPYPPEGTQNYRQISGIRAWDQQTNGHGAYASILSGGINATNVIVRFTSQRNYGIDFVLEIFLR